MIYYIIVRMADDNAKLTDFNFYNEDLIKTDLSYANTLAAYLSAAIYDNERIAVQGTDGSTTKTETIWVNGFDVFVNTDV